MFSALPGGYRNNNGNFNNIGNNGNWWSATENDADNAWNRNLNYDNDNLNRNNNNKGAGLAVRLLRDLKGSRMACGRKPACHSHYSKSVFMAFTSTKDEIVSDLFRAYFKARKNKRSTINALAFEKYFEPKIFELADDIVENRYKIRPSICFIVKKPVKREIFAADFRDRVVHHFIYNYISPIFEKVFINDAYSCRIGKGTHYGISRVEHFFRSCSQNYKQPAYVLKLDISGYFMAMNKIILFAKTKREIVAQKSKVDFDLPMVLALIEKTIFNDPRGNCIIKSEREDWYGLPKTKSLFHTEENCGLPIGNLTSQLFGNIYLSDFDHFVKRDLGIRYYGRYVDDFVIVHNDREYLKAIIPVIAEYLKSKLELMLHPDKIYLQDITKGVNYLGALIKPHRKYIAKRTKGNFYASVMKYNELVRSHKPTLEEQKSFLSCMNSYLGVLKHYKTFKYRKKMLLQMSAWWWNYFYIIGYQKLAFRIRRIKPRDKIQKRGCKKDCVNGHN